MTQSFWQRLFKKQPTQQAVLILGSGRSGTSVMTRSLNLMGISLGTDHLLAPSKKINPKGYFENKDVIKIHKALGSKIRYRPAAEGYYDHSQIKADRVALTNYLKTFFANQSYLAIKDPRMNDYIQLWQHVLSDINVAPAEVILIRNPLDVVASNSRAWHRDTTLAMRQWQVRTLLSLRDTLPQSRILITYEELFDQPLATLKRIATKFNLPWPADEAALQAKLDDFIDPNLQTSDSGESLSAFETRTDVAPDIKALYILARQAAADPEFFASTDFQQRIAELTDRYLEAHGALYRDFNPKINGQTVIVYGDDRAALTAVNQQLASLGLTVNPKPAAYKAAGQTLQADLDAGQIDRATYPKDQRVVAEKEVLNNYLRRNAKREARWSVGVLENAPMVEMLTTVVREVGAATRSVVVYDDWQANPDASDRLVALKATVRTLHALAGQPYQLLTTAAVATTAGQAQLTAFVNAKRPVRAVQTTTQPNEALRLHAPLSENEVVATLSELCQRASADPQQQAVLDQFINLNYAAMMAMKGDQYANSLRN
ncbi:sulfotransferase family protein [Lactiplantibacillus modestisalitolerans]|uniref:Sulfotransferase family protein n=2 Tax=Lactiplantibacillus modestisalitolerans TaxID=1457219 RepID=A0ABV5WQN5_9LACO